LQAVEKGMSNAEESGIHLLDLSILAQGVSGAIVMRDGAAADACLAKMSKMNLSRILDKALYHTQKALVAWYYGDTKEAIERGRLALELADCAGSPMPLATCYLELAVSLFDDGQHKEAEKLLAKGGKVARGTNMLEFAYALHGARFAFDLGREEGGLSLVREGLALGRREGYVHMYRWNDGVMSRLCAKALDYGIETEYVKMLIVKRGLVPERAVDNWPFPVRLCTLGRFEILIEEKPVQFSGKVQKKPLEMLKALIALGGRDVPETRLSDILWPDAEGDSAHKSFEMTLLRLRKLLGRDDAVTFRAGAMTLNAGVCHADVQAFESLAERAEGAWEAAGRRSKGQAEEAVSLSEKALGMYRGPFLPNGLELDCTTSMREKMRNMALRLIGSLGSHWESEQQWRKAKLCYRKGIEIDDLFEDFYHRLMVCHETLGQRAEAVRVFGRCREALNSALGIEPSARTRAIYDRVRGRH